MRNILRLLWRVQRKARLNLVLLARFQFKRNLVLLHDVMASTELEGCYYE